MKLVVLDRDGTINQDSDQYIKSPLEWKPIPGSLEAIRATSAKAKPLYEKGDYTGYLKSFSVLKAPVDTFFEKVMVMVDDDKLRRGRLALLHDLRDAMNRVADLSKLAT